MCSDESCFCDVMCSAESCFCDVMCSDEVGFCDVMCSDEVGCCDVMCSDELGFCDVMCSDESGVCDVDVGRWVFSRSGRGPRVLFVGSPRGGGHRWDGELVPKRFLTTVSRIRALTPLGLEFWRGEGSNV